MTAAEPTCCDGCGGPLDKVALTLVEMSDGWEYSVCSTCAGDSDDSVRDWSALWAACRDRRSKVVRP